MPQPNAKYLLKGRLGAVMCDQSRLPLVNVLVRVYLAAREKGLPMQAAPVPYALLSPEELCDKADRLLCETRADAEGDFYLELSHDYYRGQALEFDVCIEQSLSLGCGPSERSGQVHLCVAEPAWKHGSESWQAVWGHNIPRFAWCQALGICQRQTLCGRVIDCHTKQALPGVRVAAFGLDWNQDQAIGQAVTDSRGRFLIQAKTLGFRRVKAGAGRQSDSYDLYFRIQSQVSAFPLYVDSISWGDRPTVEEALRCLHVDIFVETDLARLREEGRVASFLALTGSKSVLGLRSSKPK